MRTIGDTLSAKGISWAWYAGGWNAALADDHGKTVIPRKDWVGKEPFLKLGLGPSDRHLSPPEA
jgi:hypothetical protein